MRLFLLLVSVFAVAVGGKNNRQSEEFGGRLERLEAVVDGQVINNEDALKAAMGLLAINLNTADSDLAVDMEQPAEFGMRAKDMKSAEFSGSALSMMANYGFLEVAVQKTEQELDESDNLIGPEEISEAIGLFQEFYKLEKTGTMTQETINLMSKDRCGVKDVEYEAPSRAKRYVLSRKQWGTHTLKYWINPDKITYDMPLADVRREITNALTMWADIAHISFLEVGSVEERPDIKISFEYGDHDDNYPFAGPGGVLGHAFYPYKGILHFDDSEEFTSGTIDGINLLFVAVHEMGHILGIKHSDMRDATMYAWYPGFSDNLVLNEDDIHAAEEALGAGSGTVTPLEQGGGAVTLPPTEQPASPPDCIAKIDAAFMWDSSTKYVYIFAGAWYYRLKEKDPSKNNYMPVYDTSAPPKLIGVDGFIGLPRHVDASIESLQNVNQFYVFKGDHYYLYDIATSSVTANGSISEFWPTDTPTKIDGALKINSYTVGYIVGDRLYKYNSRSDTYSVGAAGSNYFGVDNIDSLSIAFYRKWTWVFQGTWYSVAKSNNGDFSSSYQHRPIKNDLKLPMCDEGVGALSTGDRKVCKKELKKFKKGKGFVPSAICKDYITERYSGEIRFNSNDFA